MRDDMGASGRVGATSDVVPPRQELVPFRETAKYVQVFDALEQCPAFEGWEHWEIVGIVDRIVADWPELLPQENRPPPVANPEPGLAYAPDGSVVGRVIGWGEGAHGRIPVLDTAEYDS